MSDNNKREEPTRILPDEEGEDFCFVLKWSSPRRLCCCASGSVDRSQLRLVGNVISASGKRPELCGIRVPCYGR